MNVGWSSIGEMFNALHQKKICYVILRNYEEIYSSNFYIEGHGDIDFLTENSKVFTDTIQAYPRFLKDDGIHYKVMISGSEIIIDVRSVGDWYYDLKWEKEILKSRVLKDSRFYVPDEVNSYYSLVYHAILQKESLSNEYLDRLNKISVLLGICADSEQKHLEMLNEFILEKGYYYTIPYDIHVPLRIEMIDNNRVKKHIKVKFRDFCIRMMQNASRIKHLIIR